jgi:hypothetical protein
LGEITTLREHFTMATVFRVHLLVEEEAALLDHVPELFRLGDMRHIIMELIPFIDSTFNVSGRIFTKRMAREFVLIHLRSDTSQIYWELVS